MATLQTLECPRSLSLSSLVALVSSVLYLFRHCDNGILKLYNVDTSRAAKAQYIGLLPAALVSCGKNRRWFRFFIAACILLTSLLAVTDPFIPGSTVEHTNAIKQRILLLVFASAVCTCSHASNIYLRSSSRSCLRWVTKCFQTRHQVKLSLRKASALR